MWQELSCADHLKGELANLTTCFGIEDPAAVPVTIGHLMMNQLEDEEVPNPSEFIQSRNGVDLAP